MHLRDRSRDLDDGASTSRAQPVHSLSEEYVFPERLVKGGDWQRQAFSNKTNYDTTTALNLALVFDFVSKFGTAFNLTPVSEQQLDDAIVASTDAMWSQVTVRLAVELLRGFTSLDQHHQIRMYHRNRVYRETTEHNYNASLWEFFEHDWKVFKHGNTDHSNCFARSKEQANLFDMEPRIRAAILNDLCQYRLSCFDAQDIIDSMVQRGDTCLGDQLRTEPIGQSSNEKYYYLGGCRVYRCTLLTANTTKRSRGRAHSGRTAKRARAHKHNTKRSEEPQTTDDALSNGHDCNTDTTVTESSGTEWRCSEECTWEVMCRTEEDVHWLIEALRSSRSAWCVSLVNALIARVLPSVIKNKAAERKKQRSVPLSATALCTASTEVRHSSRLQSKKAQRIKLLEEAKKQDLELEAELREEECRRAVAGGTRLPFEMCKQLSREERTRLREQRMEQYRRERRLSTEIKRVLPAPHDGQQQQPTNGAHLEGAGELHQQRNGMDIGLPSEDKLHPVANAHTLPVRGHKQRMCRLMVSDMRGNSWAGADHTRDSMTPRNYRKSGIIPLGRMPSHSSGFVSGNNNDGSARTRPLYWRHTPWKKTRGSAWRGLREELLLREDPIASAYYEAVSNEHCSSLQSHDNGTQRVEGLYSADASLSSAYCLSNDASLEQDCVLHDDGQDTTVSPTESQALASPDCSRPALAHFYSTDRVLSQVYEHTTSPLRNDMATRQNETELGYVDYPTFKEGVLQWFRLVEPLGTRVLLHRDGPLQHHDYYLPSVEEIVANKWRFSVDPIDRSLSDHNNDFYLFFGDADGHVNASFGHAVSTNTCTSYEYTNTFC